MFNFQTDNLMRADIQTYNSKAALNILGYGNNSGINQEEFKLEELKNDILDNL